MRAVGAKTVQAERQELARMAEAQPALYKSSRRRYHGGYVRNRSDTRLYNGGIGIVPQCNVYGYFCAYSATIV